jgi:hypothetical protein
MRLLISKKIVIFIGYVSAIIAATVNILSASDDIIISWILLVVEVLGILIFIIYHWRIREKPCSKK